jgi:excinuclease ABC subunit C
MPRDVMLPADCGFNRELLEKWFRDAGGRPVNVEIPSRGSKKDLIEMAEQNARLYLIQKQPPDHCKDLQDLQRALCLPRFPGTIEAFDISNLGKSFAVAAMVRFVDGAADKSGYRKYKIRSVNGQNDFAMLIEAVERRLTRLDNEKKPFPDMFLVDGGKGQLHAVQKPLSRFVNAPMIVSLAKEEEVLFSPYLENPVSLPSTHPARKLVQRIRDEVHRFAITYHRTLRDRQFRRSALEDIPGIGTSLSRRLLKQFGSFSRIKQASVEELSLVKGIPREKAIAIKKFAEKQ